MEEKAEERDLKRMKFVAELEDKRSTKERNHEERMQSMMMGYMTHMMSMVSGNHVTSFPYYHQVQATCRHLFTHFNVYLPLTLNLNPTLLVPFMTI